MPEPNPAQRRIVAFALMGSAVVLAVAAGLAYSGVLPLGEEVRGMVAMALGGVAAIDFVIGVVFFVTGQSS